jgi:ubiquinone/menaquinone biosynthesis C-methylase UbiE
VSQYITTVRHSILQQYSQTEALNGYTSIGLFPSEEKLVKQFFQPASSILEIGCGAGRSTIALAHKGYKVIGVDLVPEMLFAAQRQAKQLGINVNFVQMDATEMNFADGSIQNVLFSYNTFDQIPGKKNREKILQNIYRILAPGGIFILTTRSGLAPGRRTIAWMGMCAIYLAQSINIFQKDKWEWGDRFWRGTYYHYHNPFQLRNQIRRLGFTELLFNSEKNVDNHRAGDFFTHFSNDRILFYVFQKH